jgi:hypothetical protein
MPRATPNPLIHWLGVIVSAAGFGVICIQVIRLWLDPLAWGDARWIGYMPTLLGSEFALLIITLVAAGLASATDRVGFRVLIAAGLLGLFFAPSIIVARMLGDDPLADYLLVLIGTRFLVLVGTSVSGSDFEELLGHAAVSVTMLLLVLLGMLLLTAVVPMPMGGLDAKLLDQILREGAETAWDREPQRALATVVVYCLVMIWMELMVVGPAQPKQPTAARLA